jgi:hypothetical protein
VPPPPLGTFLQEVELFLQDFWDALAGFWRLHSVFLESSCSGSSCSCKTFGMFLQSFGDFIRCFWRVLAAGRAVLAGFWRLHSVFLESSCSESSCSCRILETSFGVFGSSLRIWSLRPCRFLIADFWGVKSYKVIARYYLESDLPD